MKKKKKEWERDVDECEEKINAILKEYNCRIEVDFELGGSVIILDLDNSEYALID